MNNQGEKKSLDLNLFKELIDDSTKFFYAVDVETLELLYVNKRFERLLDKPFSCDGKTKCYAFLFNKCERCKPCVMDNSDENLFTQDTFVDESGREYSARNKIVTIDGRKIFIEELTDETDVIRYQTNLRDLLNGIPGGVGIYNFYPESQDVEVVYLNDGYYSLIGSEREKRNMYNGFAIGDAVYPDDYKQLLTSLTEAVGKNTSLSIDIRVLTDDKKYKWINVRINFAHKVNNFYTLYVFHADIDDLKTVQLKLDASHKAMGLASTNSGIHFWNYFLKDRRAVQEFRNEFKSDFPPEIHNLPDSILGTGEIVYEDEAYFKRMFNEINKGANTSECTIRLLNHRTSKFEWQHFVFNRLDDSVFHEPTAIGICMNVDLAQESKQRYEKEVQLRRELIKNSIVYCQFNASTRVLEEFHTMFMDTPNVKSGITVTPTVLNDILKNVHRNDRQRIFDLANGEYILDLFHNNQHEEEVLYRRHIPGVGLRWIKCKITIMERPSSKEIVGFLYCVDVDKETKDRQTFDDIMEEEIESIFILNIKTKSSRMVHLNKCELPYDKRRIYDYNAETLFMINSQVIQEDKEMCKEYFKLDNLLAKLALDEVTKLTYRTHGDGPGKIALKKTRVFYLDDSHEDLVIIRRDITDLFEEEQRQKKELEEAVSRANAGNKAKGQFLARMSHDMRTPLTSILALSGEEFANDLTIASAKELLAKINTSGNYLLSLINDVLDMTKIENNKMVLQIAPYSFEEFRTTINTIIGEQCRKKNIDFSFIVKTTTIPWIVTDKVRFNQIFVNLLSNAVKFTPSGGKVELLVEHVEVTGNRIYSKYVIKDNGIGMSKEFLPHAFDSFSQENQSGVVKAAQGSGLGLAIVKQIVSMMDGSINVTSELGKGTTFVIELKTQVGEEPKHLVAKDDKYLDLRGIKILLCEDNEMNAEILSLIMEKVGIIVDVGRNGLDGFNIFKKSEIGAYQAILMDIRMPIMNGIDACKAIRKLERSDSKRIPIIALTADAFDDDMQNILDAGMNDRILKPLDPKKLFEMLRALVIYRK